MLVYPGGCAYVLRPSPRRQNIRFSNYEKQQNCGNDEKIGLAVDNWNQPFISSTLRRLLYSSSSVSVVPFFSLPSGVQRQRDKVNTMSIPLLEEEMFCTILERLLFSRTIPTYGCSPPDRVEEISHRNKASTRKTVAWVRTKDA